MFAPLERVLVRRPDIAFGYADPARWHYTEKIDLGRAQAEHDAFTEILRETGAEVIYHDGIQPDAADAIFVFDPAIVTDHGAVILRMGKPLRRNEPGSMADRLATLDIPILGRLSGPAQVEGGDTVWLDERTLAVGRGFRTNDPGISQLRTMLEPLGIQIVTYDLPYYDGVSACLHLGSYISLVDTNLAVVYRPLMAVPLYKRLRERGVEFVDVPEAEFSTLGSNVLALAPRRCLMLDKNPVTRAQLEAKGCEVLTYTGDEISCKAEGGPTCLTRPILRRESRG